MKFTHKAIIVNVAFQFGVEYMLMEARQALISTHDRLLQASTVKRQLNVTTQKRIFDKKASIGSSLLYLL